MSSFKKMLGLVLIASLAGISAVSVGETKVDAKAADAVKERIAPVGKTCLAGEPCAAAAAPAVPGAPKSGKDVFGSVCTTCHTSGLLGAPKYGSAADWAPRAAKGLDTLYSHALAGFNSMPPKGTCATCSDDEIKAAVKYMVDNSK